MTLATLRDLSDAENVKDAAYEFTLAEAKGSDALAEWARTWGQPACDALREAADDTATREAESDGPSPVEKILDAVEEVGDEVGAIGKLAGALLDAAVSELPDRIDTLVTRIEKLSVDVAAIDGGAA